MICTKCGAPMDQTDKNTFTGRVIREYVCRKCGHTDWEDDGVALWQVLHDAREQDEAESRRASCGKRCARTRPPPGIRHLAMATPHPPLPRQRIERLLPRLCGRISGGATSIHCAFIASTCTPPQGVYLSPRHQRRIHHIALPASALV